MNIRLLCLSAFVGFKSFVGYPLQAESVPSRHIEQGISVSGECLAKVLPDRGMVTVASSVVAQTHQEASKAVTKNHESMKAAIRNLGLKDLLVETAQYTVYQDCSYHEGKRTCHGYRATIATRCETSEIPRLGDVAHVATQHGSNEVSDMRTFASPELLAREHESCLAVATRNAAQKAASLAKSAGVSLGKVLSITESPEARPFQPSFRQVEAMAMSQADSAGPTIESRPLDLRVVVGVVYGIE